MAVLAAVCPRVGKASLRTCYRLKVNEIKKWHLARGFCWPCQCRFSPNELGFELSPGNVRPAPWWLWSCHQNPSSRSIHGCTTGSTPQKCQWQSWTQEPGKSRQGLGKMEEKILSLSCHPIPSPGTTLSYPGGCKPLQRGPWTQWSCDSSAETVTALTSWTYRKPAFPSGCPFVQRKKKDSCEDTTREVVHSGADIYDQQHTV